jgi:hypothetical protein
MLYNEWIEYLDFIEREFLDEIKSLAYPFDQVQPSYFCDIHCSVCGEIFRILVLEYQQ